ncbi:MAG: hypothetical protein WA061_05455 [Microgenomates group bacterium]
MIYEIQPQQSSSSGRFFNGGISQIYMLKSTPKIAELHLLHVEKPDNGLGTVLLLCGSLWAAKMGLATLEGGFTPIGDEDAVRHFYQNRGIAVDGGRISGDILRIIERCQSSLQQKNIGYKFSR